jgi:heme-degrading monooxygenase HmoA
LGSIGSHKHIPLWRCTIVIIIFTSKLRADIDLHEYDLWATRMVELVEQHPGFLSRTSWTAPDGTEVTIARFASEEAVAAWRTHPEHLQAQQLGRSTFYEFYRIEVCTPVREYEFSRERPRLHPAL